MGSRDHSWICDVCEHERGGMNNVKCICEDPEGQAGIRPGYDSELTETLCERLSDEDYKPSDIDIADLVDQARAMLDRLQVDPGGGDIIDAHECAIELLRHRAETAEAELTKSRAHLKTALADIADWKRRWAEITPRSPDIEEMLRAAREELKQAIHPDTAVRVVANVDGHHPLVSTYLTGNEVELLRWLAARIAEQPFVQARTPMYGMALEVLDKVAKRP